MESTKTTKTIKSLINPFDLLGVTIKNTPADVKKAYYELALLCHPDKGGNAQDMRLIHNAKLYIMEQLEQIDRDATYEKRESEFDDFCKKQLDTTPDFIEIFEDRFETRKFNKLFEQKVNEGDEKSGLLLEGVGNTGYGDSMDESEYRQHFTIPLNELSPTDLSFEKSDEDAQTNTKTQFSYEMLIYHEPKGYMSTESEKMADLKKQAVGDYSGSGMCDYKQAFAQDPVINIRNEYDDLAPEEDNSDIPNKLEELINNRNRDVLLYDKQRDESPDEITFDNPRNNTEIETPMLLDWNIV
jgi:curved DNA-binding protein CbpA